MIGFLNCYRQSEDAPSYQLDYEPMFLAFFNNAGPDLKVKTYRVPLGEVPKSPKECNAWVISGSPKGAYDQDKWILQLGEFIQSAHQAKCRMVGICFGHQMIAHFLGGKTEKSAKGWGVGVQQFTISKTTSWMTPPLAKASLLFSHQDQVVKLPQGAEHLAISDFCKYQMYSLGDHIFCLQGHPEFSKEFARGRLEARKELIGIDVYNKASASLSLETNANVVGSWMRSFLEPKNG